MKKKYDIYNSQEYKLAPMNSIVFIKDGSNAGNFFYNYEGSKIASTCDYIEVNQNSLFVYYFLEGKNNFIINNLLIGETIPHLYKKTLNKCSINMPSLSEQQKIAKFFSLLDKQISLWERKLELYELFYKYYLNKLLFNHNNNKFPLLRFKGFEGEWEKKKIEDICWNSKNDLLQNNNFLDAPSIMKKKYDIYNSQEYKLAPMNSIVFIKDGSNAGNFFYNYEGSKIASTCDYIEVNQNSLFVYYFLEGKINFIINNLLIGETIPHLYKKTLNKCSIDIPSLSEQEKIANFLSIISKLKGYFLNSINKMKIIKDNYLTKLFI